MIGGDSKLVLTCTHMFPHTHTHTHTHNSYLETQRDREITHTSPNGGRDLGKRKDLL